MIFSCLSHDVVAHETTHALVDGLRSCYLDPSSADQAAFHEGISDVVALFSVFALDDVVKAVLDRHAGELPTLGGRAGRNSSMSKTDRRKPASVDLAWPR